MRVGPTIVIDAAHGGTDNGAQGPNGIVEKDVVLRFARLIRADFERQGYHVVMTRNDDSNPSYEDRAAAANSHHDAIFITVHVASTGKLATARAYSYKYSNAVPAPAGASGSSAEVPKNLVVWEEAQRQYLDASHRFADLAQTELAQRFTGSALSSTPFAVRELRSVAAPAIAVEISNISVSDANTLAAMGPSLAGALLRSVQIMRPSPAVPQNSDGAGARPPGAN